MAIVQCFCLTPVVAMQKRETDEKPRNHWFKPWLGQAGVPTELGDRKHNGDAELVSRSVYPPVN